MAEWITVIALVVIGLSLIIAEVIFVPGTTLVGIIGMAATGFGIFLSFSYFGSEVGWGITVGSVILFGISLYFSLKGNTWDRFSLKSTIDSKVNEGLTSKLKVGDEGIAMSAIRPMGKADFHDVEYEVRSMGNYIDSGTTVKIIKIDINNIFVEPIN
ncbi:hypothetical protein JMN32_11850 [Fulvivirga sp. 29W222]|uniref:NfeD-like C-terminal domain-containing protein n=1 Tax=Fulvivirga marina TaxID=2494733 RepID=A0A937FXV6_9BACT|nr:NfeD family protein [Fulvivirga marina]MBL6447007.1 hypothetical protein [Fulvivirga marina]